MARPKTRIRTVLLVFLIALTQQAYGADSPTWIHGAPPQKWSRSQFMSAVGSGRTLEEASAAAKRALAEVFRARVRSHFTKDASSNQIESSSGKSEGTDQTQIAAKLEIDSEVQLRMVEIVESFSGDDGKDFYALAALNKVKVKNLYSRDAIKIRSTLQAKLGAFNNDHRAAAGREILDLVSKYESISREYAVIADGHPLPLILSGREIERIRAELRGSAAARSVVLEFAGESADFSDSLSSCLTARSLRVVDGSESKAGPRYRVKVSFKEKPVVMKIEGWVKNNFSLVGDVSEDSDGLGSVAVAKESVGRSRDASLAKVGDDLSGEFCEKIAKLIEQ